MLAVDQAGEGVTVRTAGAVSRFDLVVVAAGVWSRDLVRRLGLRVALETERGYNTTWAVPPIELPAPLFFAEHWLRAPRPSRTAMRVGVAIELAAVDVPPNFARAAAFLRASPPPAPGRVAAAR